MTKLLIINGPNLNNLGKRDAGHYGSITLDEVNAAIGKRGEELGVETSFFQSNHEGGIVDHIQASSAGANGVIINGGALTQVGYSILDALLDTGLPVVEVHLSNIHAREEFRRHSVIAPYAVGQIAGLGWRGYIYAMEFLVEHINESKG